MNDSTMTKADLVEEVIRVTDLPRKESEAIVETIFDSIIQALQTGDKIEIRGFGSFRTRQRRGRVGRNPKTGAKVEVPPKRIPFFKPSKELKDFVNTSPASARRRPLRRRRTAVARVDPPYGLSLDPLAVSLYRPPQQGRRLRLLRCRRLPNDDARTAHRLARRKKLHHPESLSLHVRATSWSCPYAHEATLHALRLGNALRDDVAGAARPNGALNRSTTRTATTWA